MADRDEQEISLVPADRLKAADPQETEVLSTPEISAPMLDVHAPHEAVRTWKDFFIHIAAIAVGLLIALGLEQTVEYFHHRNQVAETREALRVEREQNHLRLADQLAEFRVRVPTIQTNLAMFHYLRLHPGSAEKDLPGKVSWHNAGAPFIDYVWQTAEQTGVTSFMNQGEVRRNSELYRRLKICNDAYNAFRKPTPRRAPTPLTTPIFLVSRRFKLKNRSD